MWPSLSGAIPANPSPQLRTVLDFLVASGEGDVSKMNILLTPDFVHHLHPRSLQGPPLEKAEWIGWNVDALPFFKDFKVSEPIPSEDVGRH